MKDHEKPFRPFPFLCRSLPLHWFAIPLSFAGHSFVIWSPVCHMVVFAIPLSLICHLFAIWLSFVCQQFVICSYVQHVLFLCQLFIPLSFVCDLLAISLSFLCNSFVISVSFLLFLSHSFVIPCLVVSYCFLLLVTSGAGGRYKETCAPYGSLLAEITLAFACL